MRLFTFLLFLLFSQVPTFAQDNASENNGSVFVTSQKLEVIPNLLAISVKDLDSSIGWYTNILGFGVVKRYEFPEDHMRLAFLKTNGFELELIEIANSLAFLPPDTSNPATRQGLVKLAFYTDSIDDLYAIAVKAGAKIQSSLRNSNRTGGRFFILLDPDSNWIQIYGPKAN